MSLSSLIPVAYGIHPAAGANGSPSKPSKFTMMNRRAPPLQVKEKEQPRLQESLKATSRREMVHLTAASVGLLSLILPASAEARPRNATIRQKILKKFEELREKAGLPKPKDEGQEKKPEDGVESKSKIQNGAKETKPKDEKKHATPEKSTVPSTEEPSVPALPSIINGSVETTLP